MTPRGYVREDIYLDGNDRNIFVAALGEVCERYDWIIHAYCLMSNHYHFVLEMPGSNLSKDMRKLNGVYIRQSNCEK